MTVKQRQHLLAYLGYYVGSVDGDWGTLSKTACTAFQKDFGGITVDGYGGTETDKALRHAVDYDMFKPTVSTTEIVNTTTEIFWEYNPPRHFGHEEFRCPCGNCGGFPVEPQENIVRAADDMREAFGSPVIIVPPDGHSGGSGVRCQAYNDSLPGSVSNSRHVQGKAVDFSAPGVSASTIEAYLAKIKSNGIIRYWYKISAGSYHMDVD